MFYNDRGQPDPGGQFKLIDGKLVLRDGGHIGVKLMLMDGAPPAGKRADATLTDAEKCYAVERARAKHNLRYGYLPAAQRPAFTGDTAAIADAAATKGARPAESPDLDALRSVARAERAAHKYLISNAWRR